MAATDGSDGKAEKVKTTTTLDQRWAMAQILLHLYKKHHYGYADMARDAGLAPVIIGKKADNGKHIQNFITKNGEPIHADKIKSFIRRLIDEPHPAFVRPSPSIQGLIWAMEAAPSDKLTADNALQDFVEGIAGTIVEKGGKWPQRLSGIYGGTWIVVRYSAHYSMNVEQSPPDDPGIVYAALEIIPSPTDTALPAFKGYYKPTIDRKKDPPKEVKGNIISLGSGEYMMFVGYDDNDKYPMVITTRQDKSEAVQPDSFHGFILRKHERGSFITGYVYLFRTDFETLEELAKHETLKDFGIKRRSELVKLLEPWNSRIATIVENILNKPRKPYENGQAMLRFLDRNPAKKDQE